MDSGNALSKLPTKYGQFNYNFFVEDLTSITNENLTKELPDSWDLGMRTVETVSMWFGAVGHSEFAKFDQYGNEEANPLFPY